MSEDIEKILDLAESHPAEPAGKDAVCRCTHWATVSMWSGSVALMLALLAFPFSTSRGSTGVAIWLCGIVAFAVAMVSAVTALIRIACSHGRRRGYAWAGLGLGLALLSGLALIVWAFGMIARSFRF